MRSRRVPRPLALAIGGLAPQLAPQTLLAQVQLVWREAAGAAIAAEATPVAERGGTVRLACSSSVWAQELDLMAPELIERLNAELGRPAVKGLRPVPG